MIGAVGVSDPSARSMVTPKAFAGTPVGSGGNTTLALPVASGLNVPAGIGALPFAGITHSSYALLLRQRIEIARLEDQSAAIRQVDGAPARLGPRLA